MDTVRIVFSDGSQIQLANREITEVAEVLNRASSVGLTIIELEKGTWVNPNQIASMFLIG